MKLSFEITDLVAQDEHGVVFRAEEHGTQRALAVRRFFPYGKDSEGLDEVVAGDFEQAAAVLATIEYPSLRRVLEGAVDPQDLIPYLVTEWVEGISLSHVPASGGLEPELLMTMLEQALAACEVLSQAIGIEGIWIETEPAAVVYSQEEQRPGFTFWLSPFKWLGSVGDSRGLDTLAALAEKLAGWEGKLVSDAAGHGLGGWIKWAKNHPHARLGEAKAQLKALQAARLGPTRATEHVPTTKGLQQPSLPHSLEPRRHATKQAAPLKPVRTGLSWVLVPVVLLVLCTAGLVYWQRSSRSQKTKADTAQLAPTLSQSRAANTSVPHAATPDTPQSLSPSPDAELTSLTAPTALAQEAPRAAPQDQGQHATQEPALAAPRAQESASERASRLARDLAAQSQAKRDMEVAVLERERRAQEEAGGTIAPTQRALIDTLNHGEPFPLCGLVTDVILSRTGKSVYLIFEGGEQRPAVRGLIYRRQISADELAALRGYIGSKVRLEGRFIVESNTRRRLARIDSISQIHREE